MTTDRIRIGFVGLGAVVRRRHLPILGKLDGVELAAVANRSPESTRAAASEIGIDTTFADWRELVAWEGVDVVWCGTYPNTHRAVVEAALTAGKHVFCQARMAGSYDDALAMFRAAEASDRTTIICPYSKYEAGGHQVMQILEAGTIGEPRHALVVSFGDRFADPDTPIHWRQMAETFGINVLDLGQLVEVQQRWLGPVAAVNATAHTFVEERPDPKTGRTRKVESPDSSTVVTSLQSGAAVTFVLSRVARRGETMNSFHIFGSEGSLRYEPTSETIQVASRRGDEELTVEAIAVSDTVEARFIHAVRSGVRNPGPVTFLEGLRYMETTEAVRRALQSGETVRLPLSETPPELVARRV